MTVADNYDANDVEAAFGLDRVRDAFNMRRSTLPPIPPYDDEGEPSPLMIKATPFVWRDPRDIPPRRWLYGRQNLRKFLSLDLAAGGIGKSSVKVGEALAMVSNQPLLRKEVFEGPLRVWLYNLEDPLEETERRLHAAMDRFELSPSDVGDRLYVDSGRVQPVCIAEETASGARIIRPVVDAIIAELKEREIDVLILDPFVSSHKITENDNGAIDMVAKQWAAIAEECNCSINLVHHVRKSNGAEVSAESSRGAVALIDAARSVIVYNRMTKEEAQAAGVDPGQARFYFRTQNDKANLSPPEAADWFRMNNVDLPNGDSVGVACPWDWPDAFDGVQAWHLKRVQQIVGNGEFRADVRSKDWVGNTIAEVLEIDPKKQREKLKKIIKTWVDSDMLREVARDDKHRNERIFVEVGIWHTD